MSARAGSLTVLHTAIEERPAAPPEEHFTSATVLAVKPTILLNCKGEAIEARRAKSCLVAPEVGDRVLGALVDGTFYVLAVLEGKVGGEPEPTRLSADAGLRLESTGGRVTLCSAEGVDVLGARDVTITTREVAVNAKAATISVEELGFFGRVARAHLKKAELVATELDQVLTRFSQRAERAYRFVTELDQVRAGAVDIRAENVAAIRAENTLVTARVLAKVDGEQIHIG
ncbi:MAG: DUF3540 domain-containing protein [Polyangiaceae bacterium]